MTRSRRTTQSTSGDSSLITSPATKVAQRKAKGAVIITAAKDFINQRNNFQRNENGSAYGLLPKILARYSSFNITRQQLRRAVKKIDADSLLPSQLFPSIASCPVSNNSSPISLLTGDSASSTTATVSTITTSTTLSAIRSTGGRPLGSTRKARDLKSKQRKDIIEEASQRLLDAQKKSNGRLKRNAIKTIIRDLEVENELDEGYLDEHIATVKTRVYRSGNASGLGNSQTSPLSELEPLLIDYCIKLSEIGQPMTKANVMALVESMIGDQQLEKKVIAWKKKHCSYKEGQPLVGNGWYRRFVRRNDDKLRRTRQESFEQYG